MRKFRSLLSLNFRAMLTTFRFGGRKSGRHATGAGALLLLAGLSLYLSGVYSFLFAAQLAQVGQLSLLLPSCPCWRWSWGCSSPSSPHKAWSSGPGTTT